MRQHLLSQAYFNVDIRQIIFCTLINQLKPMIHELIMCHQPCSKPMSSFSRSVIHFDRVPEPERG